MAEERHEILFELRMPATRCFIKFGEIPILTASAVHEINGIDGAPDEEKRYLMHGFTRIEHEKALKEAEEAGLVIPLNATTYRPEPFNFGDVGARRLVTLKQFKDFALNLGIDVVIEPDSDVEAIQYAPTMPIDHIARALAEQNGMDSGALLRRLMEAAELGEERGGIAVRDPKTELKYKPRTVIREFWDLMAIADVNKWLEAQGVGYRLQLLETTPISEKTKKPLELEPEQTAQQKYNWIAPVRDIAIDCYKLAIAKQWGTDQESISKEVEKVCKSKGIKTDKNKALTSGYILRHALTPWDIPEIVLANSQN